MTIKTLQEALNEPDRPSRWDWEVMKDAVRRDAEIHPEYMRRMRAMLNSTTFGKIRERAPEGRSFHQSSTGFGMAVAADAAIPDNEVYLVHQDEIEHRILVDASRMYPIGYTYLSDIDHDRRDAIWQSMTAFRPMTISGVILTPDEILSAAVRITGIAESDIRSVELTEQGLDYVVRMWNHRRATFPRSKAWTLMRPGWTSRIQIGTAV